MMDESGEGLSTVEQIRSGQTVLGIELGSTRIKLVLIGLDHRPIASGGHDWENRLEDGIWTYDSEAVWTGIQSGFADLRRAVEEKYGVTPNRLEAIGCSAMMHGYLVFDAEDRQLVPFRTWRNNITGQAAETLSSLFDYPIPQRWSIAHLYQAILNGEPHVGQIAHATTLAGYVHWKLTGEKALGVGDASGMFPVDTATGDFNKAMLAQFDDLVKAEGFAWKLETLLPRVMSAGESAGVLTEAGAGLLDPAGDLEAGIPCCPPEGDAGTGMVATNSAGPRTGNVSAGTSVFAMIVLEKSLSKSHREIDLVTTPDGKPVGMVHSNNGTSDLNAWVGLLGEAGEALGAEFSTEELYGKLYRLALTGEADCGGLLAYGYVSGEHITGFGEGRPLFVRSPESPLTLANFMRAHLFSALCALRKGLNVLFLDEGVGVDEIRGHGGLFKTGEVGRRIMAAATGVPVSTLATAGEGGAWGMALLAAYMTRAGANESLPGFLEPVFAEGRGESVRPEPADAAGFDRFFERYRKGLPIERAAVEALREIQPCEKSEK